MFSYICTFIYFARLESVFVKPAYEKDLNSLNDLLKVVGSIYIPSFFVGIAEQNLELNLFEVIRKKQILTEDMSEVLFKNPPRNSTFVVKKQLAKYMIQQTYDHSVKRPSLHIGSEYLHISPNSYIVPNGSPYLKMFEKLLTRYNEHGFLICWEKLTKVDLTKRGALNDEVKLSDDEEISTEIKVHKKVLTMDILQGAFYLWVIGISFSSTMFAFEIVIAKDICVWSIKKMLK